MPIKFLSIFILSFFSYSYCAADNFINGIAVSTGPETNSNADMDSYRLSLLWDWQQDWLQGSNWLLSGYYDLSLFYWENQLNHQDNLSAEGNGSTTGISFSPVFRIKPRQPLWNTFTPYVEIGVGATLLTHSRIVAKATTAVDLGNNFQFEDRIGLGLQLGSQQQFELGYRYIHYSNAGITSDNDGIDFQQLHLSFWF
ncbi:acyloxyacyl hydrolase [Endozoicomonas sp. SM1973]|uniref:Lipid A deacylase n=1 Tax=Spartinivicinus marinus TaxID=2994442 RepID=A0A853IB55_9GAMM|nr:acyloxyacyl hydrolase [Spartinivicinus marinus]MCX4026371.1 acyloxyacyl hydrolase [Spartinivicinus marinus]NYZ67284.1 acyloxyacyl hydrolase [Spartinivicinus marinus]